jgi:MFS family permease
VRGYRNLLTIPAARLLALVMVPVRLGYAMAGLSLVLLGAQTTGSYSTGGACLGVFSLGAGALGPFRGRLVDRYGQTRPLLVYVPLFCAGFAILTVVQEAWLLLALSAISGMLSPPLLASSRPLWRSVVPDELVRTAFALDSVSMQASMVAGPALAGAIAVAYSPQAAMLAVSVLVLSGGLAFVVMPASRAWPGTELPPRLRTVVALRGIRTLLLLSALSGVTLGALVVVLPAVSVRVATPLGAGLLLAVVAVGSVIGGTWAGTRHRTDASIAGRRATALAALGLLPASAAVALTAPVPAIAALLLIVGLALGPASVYLLELVDRCAPKGTAVTAFAGIVALEGATVAIGSVLAGLAVDAGSEALALLLAAGCVTASAWTYRARRRTLMPVGDAMRVG